MTGWETKRPSWLKQKWLITQYYWRWLWMSRAQRAQQKAMRKLLFNILSNAPIEKIMAGEGCSWSMTPGQEKGTMEGVQQYVKAVTGKDVKVAQRTVSTQTEAEATVSAGSQVMADNQKGDESCA